MRSWLRMVAVTSLLAGAAATPALSASNASGPKLGASSYDPDALMEPTFRAPVAPPPLPAQAAAADRTLRQEALQLRLLELEADASRVRYERQSSKLRRAAADRLRAHGIAVDWRVYDLATLHAWERRVTGAAPAGLLAYDEDALLPPGSVPPVARRRRPFADADAVLAPGSVAFDAVSAAIRRRDPDALLPLGYASRPSARTHGVGAPSDADAPLGY